MQNTRLAVMVEAVGRAVGTQIVTMTNMSHKLDTMNTMVQKLDTILERLSALDRLDNILGKLTVLARKFDRYGDQRGHFRAVESD